MKKKGGRTRRSSAAQFLDTPLPAASPPNEPPKPVMFNNSNKKTSSTLEHNHNVRNRGTTAIASSVSPPQKTLSTIPDLKDLASSCLQDLRRHIDHSHSQILKDLESSHSRLHKRLKIQTQSCQQVMDDAEKENRKMSERIRESQEAMKASYEEFMAHEQASASRVCKTSITEISQSFEKTIDVLRSRFGIPSV